MLAARKLLGNVPGAGIPQDPLSGKHAKGSLSLILHLLTKEKVVGSVVEARFSSKSVFDVFFLSHPPPPKKNQASDRGLIRVGSVPIWLGSVQSMGWGWGGWTNPFRIVSAPSHQPLFRTSFACKRFNSRCVQLKFLQKAGDMNDLRARFQPATISQSRPST